MGEMRNALQHFSQKPEVKKLVGRHTKRQKVNIKMDVIEIDCDNVD
jgi:hypothetical protein